LSGCWLHNRPSSSCSYPQVGLGQGSSSRKKLAEPARPRRPLIPTSGRARCTCIQVSCSLVGWCCCHVPPPAGSAASPPPHCWTAANRRSVGVGRAAEPERGGHNELTTLLPQLSIWLAHRPCNSVTAATLQSCAEAQLRNATVIEIDPWEQLSTAELFRSSRS
jgi:hypothetical protein